ncbi:RusA family crossover junction endodeoxyribonuclease [Candidatus Vondammii sp. HM_W22]|uniref:RusA family crossover junction endodeoxyribonuclease n=1 Tax=Candidatus Vondammii sp. HM_W22 TaxID=2687299 RepID=UPI002E7B096D|nr:RusA family crossover junction endodeoxyribonuclease [Candidatus Vondammii sp. HM_W22]
MTFYRKYDINPQAKPRMTKRDKWAKRPAVQRYHAFKDEIRYRKVKLPESGWHVVFQIQMPKSWANKKRLQMAGKPHQVVPDKDNLEKALLDSLFLDDCRVWDGRVTKIWGWKGVIWICENA